MRLRPLLVLLLALAIIIPQAARPALAGPTAVMLFPSGGETLVQGQAYTIRWRLDDYTGPSSLVRLAYSVSDGAAWTTIREWAPNTGSFEWRVPRVTSASARLRVEVLEQAPGEEWPSPRFHAISGRFRITIPSWPHVTLLSPRPAAPGDITLIAGELAQIDWAGGTGLEAMSISYSTNRMAWTPVADCVSPASRPFAWRVPNITSGQVWLRLQLRLGACPSPGAVWWTDQTEYPFRIMPPGTNRAPSVSGGADQSARSGARVTLAASASDPDGGALTYAWRQVAGPAVALSSASSPNPSFTAPMVDRAEDLLFELTATDSGALSARARALVTVLPGAPAVDAVAPRCAGPGQTVTVRGRNLGGSTLYFGGVPALTSGTDTERTAAVPAGAATGPLTLRYPWGETVALAASFEVPAVTIGRVAVTQGVKDFPLVWRKQTVVQVYPTASPAAACRPEIQGGTLQVLTTGGARFSLRGIPGDGATLTTLAVPRTTSVLERRDRAINFVVPPGYLAFDPAAFQGFRFTLLNNGVTVAQGQVSAAALPRFQDLNANRDAIRAVMVWYFRRGALDPNWASDLMNMQRTVVRTYPVSGFASDLFPRTYMRAVDSMLAADIPGYLFVMLDGERFRRAFNDTAAPGRQARLMAGVIDRSAWQASDASGRGFGYLPGSVSQFGNGPTLAQEMGHNLGLVAPWARNHDGGNIFHSRYDEGAVAGSCTASLSFGQSLVDQTGVGHPILNTYTLAEFAGFTGCANQAKSIMSYAPGQNGDNVFLEFDDYTQIFRAAGGVATRDRRTVADMHFVPPAKQDFEIVGTISQAGEVSVAQSQLKPAGVSDLPEKDSEYALYFLDSKGGTLVRHPFRVSFDVTHGGKTEKTVFSVRAPWPAGTAAVEIRRGDKALHAMTVPAAAPSISLKVEDGATGDGPLKLSWSASHPTVKELVVDLLLSRDGGQTYQPLAMSLRESSVSLPADQVPGGGALLKAVVSDGFNTASDTAKLDRPDAAPRAAIEVQSRFPAGEAVPLSGIAYDLEDGVISGAESLRWYSSIDGELGAGDLVLASLSPGDHLITLAATDSAGNVGKAQAKVTVESRRDKLLWASDDGCGRAFPDVTAKDPACQAIELLVAAKVVNGYPDSTFKPERGVTRAEFAKMAVLAVGAAPDPDGKLPFSDVDGHWAAKQGYLQTAVALGLINGFPDGTYRPEDPVTRAQAVKIAAAAMGLDPSGMPPYADISPNDWFAGWVAVAHQAGIIGPEAPFRAFTEKEFLGNRNGTRGESGLILGNQMQVSE